MLEFLYSRNSVLREQKRLKVDVWFSQPRNGLDPGVCGHDIWRLVVPRSIRTDEPLKSVCALPGFHFLDPFNAQKAIRRAISGAFSLHAAPMLVYA